MTSSKLPLLSFLLALIVGGAALYAVLGNGSTEGSHPPRTSAMATTETPGRTVLSTANLGTLVSGKLVDHEGQVLAGHRVRLWFLPEVVYMPQTLQRMSLSPLLELESTTDADGLFAIPYPPQTRQHAIAIVEEEGYAPLYAPVFDLLSNRQRELGTLTLEPGGRLQARVLQSDGSAPGEAMRAIVLHALEGTEAIHTPLRKVRDVRTLEGSVDAATGLCSIEALPPGKYVLAVEGERSGVIAPALSATFEIRSGETTTLDCYVDAGRPLRVSVRDARGALLAGARVEIGPADLVLPRELTQRAVTDDDGTFETARAPHRNQLIVRVSKDGFQTVERRVQPQHTEQSFLLQPEVTLRGVVLDARDRTPIPDVWIGSFLAAEAEQRSLLQPSWATRGVLPARTDFAGRFALPGHGAGSWQVVAKHADFLIDRSAPIAVDNGVEPTPVEILLDPGIAIEINLREPLGNALREAGLTLHRAPLPDDPPEFEGRYAMPPRGLKVYDGISDASGAASFRLLRPGAYRLYIKHSRYPTVPPFVFELDAARPNENLTFHLQTPGEIEGRVTLGAIPTRERKIFAVHASGLCFESTPSEEGEYRWSGLPPGAYVLAPRETSIPLAQVAWEQFQGTLSKEKPAVSIELAPGATIQQDFALEGPKLARVAGALSLSSSTYSVWLVPADQPLQGSLAQQIGARTDPSGRFAIADVPYGAYRLVVTPPGASPLAQTDPRAAAEQSFRAMDVARAVLVRNVVIDGPEIDLGFFAENTASAAGSIVDGDGAAIGPGFLILVRGGVGAVRAEINADGNFDLGELPHGELELRLHLPQRDPITRTLPFRGERLRIVL